MFIFKISTRYLKSQKGTFAAIVGVALGVASIVVLLGIFEGTEHAFENILRGTEGALELSSPI